MSGIHLKDSWKFISIEWSSGQINQSIFESASSLFGGAIESLNSNISLSECQFVNCSAKEGGAIYLSCPDAVCNY